MTKQVYFYRGLHFYSHIPLTQVPWPTGSIFCIATLTQSLSGIQFSNPKYRLFLKDSPKTIVWYFSIVSKSGSIITGGCSSVGVSALWKCKLTSLYLLMAALFSSAWPVNWCWVAFFSKGWLDFSFQPWSSCVLSDFTITHWKHGYSWVLAATVSLV